MRQLLPFSILAINLVGSFITPRGSTLNTRNLRATIEGETPTTSSALILPDMVAFSKGYKTVFQEIPYLECKSTLGSIPEDLMGTYYRSGPAMFSAGSIVPPKKSIVQPKQPPVPDGQDMDRMVLHPFEGDGGVLAVTFTGEGKVVSRFRFVRTIAFTAERKKGMRVYKGMDSTRKMGPSIALGLGNDFPLPMFRHHLQPGLNKNRRNTSNTRAIYWGKRLLSLWEGGQPYKLDSIALQTEGKSRLGGAIQKESDPFGGKMVYDSKKNRALFYGIENGSKNTEVTLYEFNEKFRLVDDGRKSFTLPGFGIYNDFCVTENYAIFVQPPVVANPMQFMIGKEPGKTLSLEAGPATIHLLPRAGISKTIQSLTIPYDGTSEANLQFCNAFEDGDKVVFDAIRSNGSSVSDTALLWPWGKSLDEYRAFASKKSLWRYTLDTKSGNVERKQLTHLQCSFPVINRAVSAQKHRFLYMNVGALGADVAPPQGITKYDCEKGTTQAWFPDSYEFCGEPMFAPRKNGNTDEDFGYILSVLYNGKKEESELIILDAKDIAAGPITRIPLGMAVPHGLFGCFADTDDANWSLDTISRRAKLFDKMESQGNKWNEVKSDFSGLGLRFDDMEEYFGDFFS